ncbi:hypothetical protein Sango_2760400 [Sesamum angolense]|uniref:Uncharacterized protein n=1 Tax=Sesamum angolense TaxID=2727404 RepID=A0AAE1T7Z5_9LAMI|nr:hypothetical protein Sango_2760400 [Sesamum angolense]
MSVSNTASVLLLQNLNNYSLTLMEEQCSPLGWAYYYQEEGVEELKHSLLYSTLELEAAVLSAHEEISRKDDEILQLKGLLAEIIKERDEFQAKCQQLVLEKQLLFQQVQVLQAHPSKKHLDCPISSNTTSHEDDNIDLSPSHCDDNIVVPSPPAGCKDTLPLPPPIVTAPPPGPLVLDVIDKFSIKKPLPEKGKFLLAVMEAGPLLQTLLLAGPLPQWQHPPPQLNSTDIPPVTISSPTAKILHQDSCLISPTSHGGFTNKRAMVNKESSSDFSPKSKYQKVCSPIIIEPNI